MLCVMCAETEYDQDVVTQGRGMTLKFDVRSKLGPVAIGLAYRQGRGKGKSLCPMWQTIPNFPA